MEYTRIVAVTGMSGLYEVLSSKSDGAIVRSLEEQTTKFISSRVHNLSHLESIEIYTVRENVPLSDLFKAMKENGAKLPDAKDAAAVKAYFEKVYPDLDFERVYASDMKKMVKWYDILEKNKIDFTVTTGEDEVEEATVENAEAEVVKDEAKAPEKKTRAKKATAEKEDTATAEEKPKKTRKKKDEA